MINISDLKLFIEKAWHDRQSLTPDNNPSLKEAVLNILKGLDEGHLRVAEKIDGVWQTHAWIKEAILLSFRLLPNKVFTGGPQTDAGSKSWFDKVALKCAGWELEHFTDAQFRIVPGAIIRHGAYVAPNTVVMPSFINVGAYVGENTMVDTWSTIGSCAQIGAHCHISGGVGIGGVLEPIQANPVIIEDNCFIGARSEVAEGVMIGKGSVIAMGVFLGASTKIVNRQTGDITYGYVPPYSVVVPGTLPGKDINAPSLACAVIVKQVDEKTRSKTSINELLRT